MKYLESYSVRSGIYYESNGLPIRKSTNRVHRINREDIIDIMTEITDNFEGYKYFSNGDNVDYLQQNRSSFKIINDKEVVLEYLVKNVVKAIYALYIPDKKMTLFKTCLNQAEKRFNEIMLSDVYSKLNKVPGDTSSLYHLVIVFNDSKLLE